MVQNALDILSHINMYSGSLILLVILFFLTVMSDSFGQSMKTPLMYMAVVWLIFFGCQAYTGKSLFTVFMEPSQSEIEAAKYKKVMIDGREVIYNKDTGEVVKPKSN